MKPVPVFYLRKSIYLLLAHAHKYAKQYAGEEDPFKLIEHGDYIDINVKKPLLSPNEQTWLAENDYDINTDYTIKQGGITKLWPSIHNYWHSLISEVTDPVKDGEFDYLKPFRRKLKTNPELYSPIYKNFTDYCNYLKSLHDKNEIEKFASKKYFPIEDSRLAKGVCLLSLKAATTGEDQEYIKKIIALITEKYEDNIDHEVDETNFWQIDVDTENSPKFSRLFDSHWACYERTDGIVPFNATWGIAKSYVYIGVPNKERVTPIVIKSQYASGEHIHEGKVTLEVNRKSLHLVAHLTHKERDQKTPAFFVMRLNHSKPEDHRLIVGFYLSYSIYYGRYLTKTVIWVNNEKPIDPISVSDKSEPDFTEIPQSIRSFFNDRLRNRLTMPSSDFFNAIDDASDAGFHSLEQWLDERDSELIKDHILTICASDYYVFYNFCSKPSLIKQVEDVPKFLRMDELSICKNQDSVEFEAKYEHKRFTIPTEFEDNYNKSSSIDSGMITSRTYEGSVFDGLVRRYRSTIQVIFNEKQFVDKNGLFEMKTPYGNFIHLTFGVPFVNHVAFKNEFVRQEYFVGIASGLNDSNNDPVSFRVLIIRKDKLHKDLGIDGTVDFQPNDYPNNSVIKRISKYFFTYRKRSSILIETKPLNLGDRYPYIDEIRESEQGEVTITGKRGNYSVIVKHGTSDKPIFDDSHSDLDDLLERAEEKAKEWLLAKQKESN